MLEVASSLQTFASPSLHFSYRLFIDFFKGSFSEAKIMQGAYMVYGWMPTMLKFKGSRESIYNLAKVARQGKVTSSHLTDCSKSLNNSLVGTSKLLHFIAPEIYPIWDSRVYRALVGKKPHPYRVESVDVYMEYLHWMQKFISRTGFKKLKGRFEKEAGYRVSDIRAAEAFLYALGEKPKKEF